MVPKAVQSRLIRREPVVLHDDVVNPGQYATAHVLFPASWLTHLDGKKMLANRATARLDYAIAEEKVWTDSWSFQQEALFTTFALIAFVCAGDSSRGGDRLCPFGPIIPV